MSSATPEPHGFLASPVRLFVLSTAMAATAATAVAFMLFEAQEAPECSCACEAAQTESAVAAEPERLAEPQAEPKAEPPAEAEVEVEGGLDETLIRRIVRAHIPEVRHCYNLGLSDGLQRGGRVNIQFEIADTGEVSEAWVASSSLDHEETETCIAAATKRWKFPKPEGGGAVVVNYPFVLAPG